jgi:uncharacterized membrane protein
MNSIRNSSNNPQASFTPSGSTVSGESYPGGSYPGGIPLVVVTLLELTKQDKDEIINQEKR